VKPKGGKTMKDKNSCKKKNEIKLDDPCPCGSGKKYKDCCGKENCCC